MVRTLFLLAIVYGSGASDPCVGTPFDAFPPYTSLHRYDDVVACMRSVPASQSWIDSTLDTLEAGLNNFAFLDKMKDSGPPWNIRTDFLASLEALRNKTYTADLDFQEDVQKLMTRMHDAHTQYIKGACYHATFVAPFSLRSTLVSGRQAITLEASRFEKVYENFFEKQLSPYYGLELLAIDDLEVMTYIGNFAQNEETISNDLSAAFNSALRTIMYRNQLIFSLPAHHELKLTFRVAGSEGNEDLKTVTFPWMVMGDAKLGQTSACQGMPHSQALQTSRTCQTWRPQQEFCEFTLTVPSPVSHLSAARPGGVVPILPDGRGSTISCFTQRSLSGVALFMKVRSFEPDSETGFVDDLLTCLQTPFDVVIVDVMQNGGGSIELGYKMATLLVEEFNNDPTKTLYKYDIKHSSLMDAYVAKTHSRGPDADAPGYVLDPETLQAYPDESWYTKPAKHFRGGVLGNYSKPFVFNFSEIFAYRAEQKPHKFPKPSEFLLLSDGTCGSTCATFSLILNERNLATTVGVGGISHYTMAVSSFAGGAVSNMDRLADMGSVAGFPVPHFTTSAIWQFTWMEIYSRIYPNQPAQFVMQPPTIRIPWWDFPHPSVDANLSKTRLGELYDLALNEAERLNPKSLAIIV